MTFKEKLRLARMENRDVKSLNKFLNFDFHPDRDAADDWDGDRGWKAEDGFWEISREEGCQRTIARSVPLAKYRLGYWISHPGSYWHPPEPDFVEHGEYSNIADAILEARRLELKWEWENAVFSDGLAELENSNFLLDEE